MLTAIRCDLPSDASIIVSMMSAPWEPFEIQKDFFGVGVDSGDRAILRSLSAKCKQSLIDAIKTNYTKTVAGLDDMAVTAVELTGLFR